MNFSHELSEKVQKVINEYIENAEPFLIETENSDEKVDLRKIAAELNILPVLFDWFSCWGIEPNGEIILFQFKKPYRIKTETNQKIINIVLFDAAKKHTELKDLMPVRNHESIECPNCKGTGIIKEFSDHELLSKTVRCNCGGLGWLPSADKKYLYF